ncbi:MAG: PEGA domain-containing protein [Candidatus Omnitrophica bacterium]|nr:PEGA domain-containing protein [Candidatus Omnitrophota bacterium]
MSGEQRIRALLFYLSVLIFFSGLPFILSFALGYKFDRRTFKFTRTGLIVLKTQPQGANVYLDNKLLNDTTPTTINELLPGRYKVELQLTGHYPYFSEIDVQAGNVARLEKVILFPLRPDIKKINKDLITGFWVDESKSAIYYINDEDKSIYRSDMDGEHSEKISSFIGISPAPKKWKLSPDRKELLYFNPHQIGLVSIEQEADFPGGRDPSFILNYPEGNITDVFWHSDSFHLIVVSGTKIDILEAKPDSQPVTLASLNKRNTSSFYDPRSDTLYFLDSQRAPDGKYYDNLYKIELAAKLYPLRGFIKLAPSFEKAGTKQNE